jgi:hypothetical protein
MKIHAERAFWMLEFFRRSETILDFGGHILGEKAVCSGIITRVERSAQAITLRLFSDAEKDSFEVPISLSRGTFFLSQLGDPNFQPVAGSNWHSVLEVAFPDFTILFFAERAN